MFSFKHNIVLSVLSCSHVKLTQGKKRDHRIETGHDSHLFLLYMASIYRLPNSKDSEQSDFNSSESLRLKV